MMNQFIPQNEKHGLCVCVYRGAESICPAGVFALYRQMSVRLFPKLKRWALIIGRDITKICDKIKKTAEVFVGHHGQVRPYPTCYLLKRTDTFIMIVLDFLRV
jgi:hypothetical protein